MEIFTEQGTTNMMYPGSSLEARSKSNKKGSRRSFMACGSLSLSRYPYLKLESRDLCQNSNEISDLGATRLLALARD